MTSRESRQIVMMTRYPELGRCKTRLIKDLGEDGALDLHCKLVHHEMNQALSYVHSSGNTKLEPHVVGADVYKSAEWLGIPCMEQIGGDLGEKMSSAAAHAFKGGASKVAIIGSDCPFITPEHYAEVFAALEDHDAVYIPAHDGGYVLLAMNNLYSCLFENIEWGSEHVLDQSLKNADAADLNVYVCDSLSDVDTIDDVPAALREMNV